jgi:hypothetical protein
MEKTVQKAGISFRAALVSIGWVAFLLGHLVHSICPIIAIFLAAIARVLPQDFSMLEER